MKEKMVPGLPPWPLYKGSARRWPPVLKHSTINLREGQISSTSPISKSSTNMETAARLPAEAPDTCRGKLRPAWGEADSPWLWRHEERKSWDSSPLRGGRGRGSRSQQRTSWACWELMLTLQTGCLGTVSLHQGACHHMWRGLWGLKIQSREMIPRISISDV